MSAIHERRWRLEHEQQIRERQRKIRETEVKQMTEGYLRQYEQRLQDLENQGLAQFVRESVTYIHNEINRVRSMSAYDGRNASFNLQRSIQVLWCEAIEARRIVEEHQRLLAEEARRAAERLQVQKEQVWQQATTWENKLARNLAFKDLANLKKQVKAEDWTIEQIKSAVARLKRQYENQVFEIKNKSVQANQNQATAEQKQTLLKIIETSNLPQSLSERLKQQLTQSQAENLSKIAMKIHQAEDSVLEDEEVRKEMVRAVYQSLKQAGFTVLNPKKQGNGEESVVVIQASRPQGNQAKFRVKLDGSVRYEFDNYKGQRCKEDMCQVLPRLSEIYGVDLSDERVIWENPDDELSEARPITPLQTTKNAK